MFYSNSVYLTFLSITSDRVYLYNKEYPLKALIPFLVFFGILCVLACILVVLSYILSFKRNDAEKASAYECGFNAFNDARSGYFFNFYIIALLYIIFDLEVIFLLPYSIVQETLLNMQIVIILFIILLVLGYLYEYLSGSLKWR